MKKTQKRINAILASLENGSSQVDACKAVGITYVAFYLWQQSDKKLKAKVEAILNSRIIVIEDVYYKRLVTSTASPVEYIFYLKNRAPERWKDTYETVTPSATINVFVKNILTKAGLDGQPETKAASSPTEIQSRLD